MGDELLDAAASAFMNTNINITMNNQNLQFQNLQFQYQQFQNLQYQHLLLNINQFVQAGIYNQNLPQLQEYIRRFVLDQSILELNIMNATLWYFFNHYPAFSQKVNWIYGWFCYWRNYYGK